MFFARKTLYSRLREYVAWFEPSRGSQEKRPFSNGLFSIQSEGLACNLTAGEYVIAEGVWHHASACISPSDWLHTSLRDDSIQDFALIPYRRQAADFIHAYRRDYIESYVEVLEFQGLFRFFRAVFWPFVFCTFSPTLWTWTIDIVVIFKRILLCTNW